MYRTGDRARVRGDGALEFLGRLDDQVKVRGFRVEPGEVEAALAAHPAVREAAAAARDDARGERVLVGYVVPDAASPPSAGELRAFLRARLPEHLVPGAFVFLDALPLSPNGKVDRRALPAPSAERPQVEAPFVAPRTGLEESLAAMWREVLGVERVGVDDGFFELGGHSLRATQVVSRVRDVFGVEVPLRRLFEAPTVAGFSVAVVQEQAAQAGAGVVLHLLSDLSARTPHPPTTD
jgi:acyl carrier protein